MSTDLTPKTSLDRAAFSDFEIEQIERFLPLAQKYQIFRRINRIGSGKPQVSLFDLTNLDADDLIDGRRYYIDHVPTEAAICAGIAELTLDYEAHRADTTPHAVADATNTMVFHGGAATFTNGDVNACRTQLNAIKAALNAHMPMVSGGEHDAVDTRQVVSPDITAGNWVAVWRLYNEAREKFIAHIADDAVHQAEDTTNTISTIPISSSTSAYLVRASYKWDNTATDTIDGTKVLQHVGRDATSAGRFIRTDLVEESSLDGGVSATLYDLVTSDPATLKDGALYYVGTVPTLGDLNAGVAEMTLDYTAHIADATAHIGADGVNTLGATVYVKGGLAECRTQLNDIKAKINAHFGTAGAVHTIADTRLVVASDAGASDLIGLWRLYNEVRALYIAHIDDDAVHPSKDTTNTISSSAISASSNTDNLLSYYVWDADGTDTVSGLSILAPYTERSAGRFLLGDRSMYHGEGVPAFNGFTLSNWDFLRFRNGQLYTIKQIPTLHRLYLAVLDLWTQYEAHRVLVGGGEHLGVDGVNTLAAFTYTDLKSITDALVDIKAVIDAHMGTAGAVHGVEDEVSVTTVPDVADYDLLGAWMLYNDCRRAYEDHRVVIVPAVHGAADTTNTMTELAISATTDKTTIEGRFRWEEGSTATINGLMVMALPDAPAAGRLVLQTRREVRNFGELVAKGVDYIAAYAGGGIPLVDATGPWTMPTPRRNAQFVASNNGGWVNNTATITGTDPDGNDISETSGTIAAGATVVLRNIYQTITGVTTSGNLIVGETLTLQTGASIYVGPFGDLEGLGADEVDELATAAWEPSQGWIAPNTAPNANVVFHATTFPL